MPTQELLDAVAAGRSAAERMGMAAGQLDIDGFREAVRPFANPLPTGTTIRSARLAGVPGAWILTPASNPAVRALYLHGGGFVAGNVGTHMGIAAYLAAASGVSVYLADYRLAPENPFPAALDDSRGAWAALRSQGPDGWSAAERLVLVGDSAGAGLAISTCLAERSTPADALVLICPFINLDPESSPSLRVNGFWRGFGAAYCPPELWKDPRVSPIFAPLEGLPRTLIQVGGHDTLAHDGLWLRQKAARAGVPIRCEIWNDCPHVWHKHVPTVPEAVAAFDRIGEFLRAREANP